MYVAETKDIQTLKKRTLTYTPEQHCRQQELIADGQYRNTSLSITIWKTLIGSQASLQTDCNKEGFNVLCTIRDASKARIGILGNEQISCSTCDSRIGFGTGGYHDDFNACGNEANYHADNGAKHIKAMGYILVQWDETDTETLETYRRGIVRKAEKCKLETKTISTDWC